jgi:hypothetical protein
MVSSFFCVFFFKVDQKLKLILTESSSGYIYCKDLFLIVLLSYWELWCLTPLSKIFHFIVAVSFIVGGNQSNRSKCCIEYTSSERDCICSYKSNNHTIKTATSLFKRIGLKTINGVKNTAKIAIFRMCYGENGTVKFLENLTANVFSHRYSMMQI